MNDLSALETIDGYRRLFSDPVFWEPFVKQICQKHNLFPNDPVRIGVPGTCPAFIVAERWVVKFFGRLFDGAISFQREKEAARLTALDPAIRAVPAIAAGELGGDGWPWPYLIYPLIPGSSIGEQAAQINQKEWVKIAIEVGEIARRLHSLSLDDSMIFPNHMQEYRDFLDNQRSNCLNNHRNWGSLPQHMLVQLEKFLPHVDELVEPGSRAYLIHADLTRDHLLGQVHNGLWTTLALIDFGDAMTGNLLYELAALYLDMFHTEPRLLAAFLDAYGLSPAKREGLARKAMAVALLHQFNLMDFLTNEMRQLSSLDELAQRLWQYPA